jgi:hypothetical protein
MLSDVTHVLCTLFLADITLNLQSPSVLSIVRSKIGRISSGVLLHRGMTLAKNAVLNISK